MTGKLRWLVFLVLPAIVGLGCASSDNIRPGRDAILLVPGVGGGGPEYSGIEHGLHQGGINRQIVTIEWGAPTPLFVMNFSDPEVHRQAEEMLANKITEVRRLGPKACIDLIGHSAGCGVVIGAIRRLPASVRVHTVILLAPSFSPQFDVASALPHIDGLMHLFFSDRDRFFLDWRTSHFGTYDDIKTPAAGNMGMPNLQSPKVVQHPYDPTWEGLGNDGGHYGPIAEGFVRQILAPLLTPAGSLR